MSDEPDVKPNQFPDERTFALWIAYAFVCRTKGLDKLDGSNVAEYIKEIGDFRDKLVKPLP